MKEIEKERILDFVTEEVSEDVFYKEFPNYLDDNYLLQQYEKAIENRDKELLQYIFMLPFKNKMKLKKVFKKLIVQNWHIENERIASEFQTTFNNDTENIVTLLEALEKIPDYLDFDDMKYPYIRKIIYAIGAQPEPNNIEALEKLVKETEDVQIKELALHQIKKRRLSGRWESKENT